MQRMKARIDTIPGYHNLVLASSSPYRRELLQRLGLPFAWRAPDIDESPLPDESAELLVARLAQEKARAVAVEFGRHLIIGGDQVGVLSGVIIGKPHTDRAAIAQLQASSGQAVRYFTSVCVLDSLTGRSLTEVVSCRVMFRRLDIDQIAAYVAAEQALDCAGGFKSEGLGIALFESIEMSDPTVLTGLPLITLVTLLQRHGLDIFGRHHPAGPTCSPD